MNPRPDPDDFDIELDLDTPAPSGVDVRASFLRDEIATLARHIATVKRRMKIETANLAEERKAERLRHAETMREIAAAEEDYRQRVKSVIAEAETMIRADRDGLKRLEAA